MSDYPNNLLLRSADKIGRMSVTAVEEIGNGAVVIGQCVFWLFMGPRYRQPVRPGSIVVQMMEIGIYAIPIIAMLTATIGIMLAIQGIYTLKIFGAESRRAAWHHAHQSGT